MYKLLYLSALLIPSITLAKPMSLLGLNVEGGYKEQAEVSNVTKVIKSSVPPDILILSELSIDWKSDIVGISDYKYIISSEATPKTDALGIFYDYKRFDLLESYEIDYSVNKHERDGLVARFRDKDTQVDFTVVANHFMRGKGVTNEQRVKQAKLMNQQFSDTKELVIAMGDYNFDYDLSTRKGNKSFNEFMTGNWKWIKPSSLYKTHCDPQYNSILDFAFVLGEYKNASSEILFREMNYCKKGFPDHRPVRLTIELEKRNVKTVSTTALKNGDTGIALRKSLKKEYYDGKTNPLNYKEARKAMYREIDVGGNGLVTGVYTGYSSKPANVSYLKPINCEHTVPQSSFNKAEPMRSDIHHLFPTHERANSKRGAFPFGEVANPETWLFTINNVFNENASPPESGNNIVSKYGQQVFEPSDSHKGNVVRAIAYFYTMYPNAGSIRDRFKGKNLSTMVKWHNIDPVDDAERERNNRIEAIQGNRNPFVDDASLLCKAWDLAGCE